MVKLKSIVNLSKVSDKSGQDQFLYIHHIEHDSSLILQYAFCQFKEQIQVANRHLFLYSI